MSDEHEHQAPAVRTLLLAAQICGGTEPLSEALGVAEAGLKEWIAGRERTPNEAFFAALDIVAAGPFGNSADAGSGGAQASADRLRSAADRAQEVADKNRSRKKGSKSSTS
jgi:hypothetical protein